MLTKVIYVKTDMESEDREDEIRKNLYGKQITEDIRVVYVYRDSGKFKRRLEVSIKAESDEAAMEKLEDIVGQNIADEVKVDDYAPKLKK